MTRRLVLGAFLAWAAVVLLPGTAVAHAALDTASPQDGSTQDQAPAQVRLTFTEPPDTGSRATVLGPGDREIAHGAVQGQAVVVSLPSSLPDGTYQVVWRVLSAADGHLTQGVTVFGVGQAPEAATARTTSGPSPFSVLGRALLYLGLAVALGGAMVGHLLYQELPHRRFLFLAPALVASGLMFLFLAVVQAAAPASVWDVATSVQGQGLLLRWNLVLVLALTCWAAIRRSGWLPMVGAVAAALAVVTVLFGHAAAPDPQRWLELVTQSIHVLVVGLWVGGLGWLLAGLNVRGRKARMMWFSRYALIGLVVIALTGTWRAWDELTSWSDLWTLAWGQVLLIKLGLLSLALGAALFNRLRGIQADDDQPLRLGMRVELGLLIAVFLVTGLLSTLNPGRVPDPRPTASGTDYAGTTALTITMTSPGVLEATLTGPAAGAETIDILATHGDQPAKEITLDQVGPGEYRGQAPVLIVGGRWILDASVEGVTVNDLPMTILTKEDTP